MSNGWAVGSKKGRRRRVAETETKQLAKWKEGRRKAKGRDLITQHRSRFSGCFPPFSLSFVSLFHRCSFSILSSPLLPLHSLVLLSSRVFASLMLQSAETVNTIDVFARNAAISGSSLPVYFSSKSVHNTLRDSIVLTRIHGLLNCCFRCRLKSKVGNKKN